MKPEIKSLSEKKLIGVNTIMSFTNNTTPLLWKSFMPRRKEITNAVGSDLYSIQLYEAGFFEKSDPNKPFEKWAAVEVTDFNTVPDSLKTFILESGLYAVFAYKGPGSDNNIFQYIFSSWLPASDYLIDNRPHFEVLGEKYKNNDPGSEEEIWIPVKPK